MVYVKDEFFPRFIIIMIRKALMALGDEAVGAHLGEGWRRDTAFWGGGLPPRGLTRVQVWGLVAVVRMCTRGSSCSLTWSQSCRAVSSRRAPVVGRYILQWLVFRVLDLRNL